MVRGLHIVVFLVLFLLTGRPLPADDSPQAEAFFHKRVEPILVGLVMKLDV